MSLRRYAVADHLAGLGVGSGLPLGRLAGPISTAYLAHTSGFKAFSSIKCLQQTMAGKVHKIRDELDQFRFNLRLGFLP